MTVINSALTEEDLAELELENGSKIDINLEIRVLDSLSDDEVDLLNSVKEDFSYGLNLDISLIKTITDSENDISTENINETKEKITVVINIPEDLQAQDRLFKVILINNGETEILPDLDENPSTITIETDKFLTTYSLLYKDREIPNTGDATTKTAIIILACITIIGVIYVRKEKFQAK